MKKMKRLSLTVLSLLMVGMTFTACSSDDEDKWVEPPLEKVYGEKVKTIDSHVGILHFDKEQGLWYIDYLRSKPVGSVERCYTQDLSSAFQYEGMMVTFSGDAYEFLMDKKESTRGESDYYVFLQSIARSNNLQQVSEIAPEVKAFLDAATVSKDITHDCDFAFPSDTEAEWTDSYYVINDATRLSELYVGKDALPAIDFGKYTLIIGRVYERYIGESFIYQDISADAEPKVLNLYMDMNQDGMPIISGVFFWGLYPKIDAGAITIKRRESFIYSPSVEIDS